MKPRARTERRNVTLYASPWEATLSALEWGKITARLSAHASSEPGRDLCAALSPGTDLDAIRASLEENRDGRRMLSARWRSSAGRGEGDPRGGREGGQGRLPLPDGTAADREDGARRGAGPPVLRGPARKVPAAGPPRERDPAAARPRRGGRAGDRHRRERAGPGVGYTWALAAPAPEDALPPAGVGGWDPLLPALRPLRPGDVRHRPVGPRRDPLQDEREGALPGNRPRLLPERPDGLLRAGGTRPPQ